MLHLSGTYRCMWSYSWWALYNSVREASVPVLWLNGSALVVSFMWWSFHLLFLRLSALIPTIPYICSAIKNSIHCWGRAQSLTICLHTAQSTVRAPHPTTPIQHHHPTPLLLKIFSKQDPLSPLKRDPLSNAKWLSWPALTVGHLLHKRSWSVK